MATVSLGSKAVGSIVKLRENGTLQEYLIVHQGLPSSLYDSSCNGTWLLRKDCIEGRNWNNSNYNVYESSEIHSWLNDTMLGKYDTAIKNAIKQVKIPYRKNGGSGGTDQSGANGLSCKVFLLSGYELGWTKSNSEGFPVDGAKLSYFESGQGTSANNKRIAKLNGRDTYWWLRSPSVPNGDLVFFVHTYGSWNVYVAGGSNSIRPALILPTSLNVLDSGEVTANTAPTTPASISIPSTIYGGNTISISWGSSSDAQGNLAGYKLEKSINGGSSWTQIYQGSARSTSDSISFGTTSVRYRVKAYDSYGLESGYKTSNQITVINNTAPTTPASITVPDTVLTGQSLVISWAASSDAQGDTIQYQLERSANGGSYTKIYDGTETSHIDTLGADWNTVQYRVRAYDTMSAYSGYRTSTSRTVKNLTIPAIVVPSMAMQGQTIPISWTAAPDADSYTLERKADSSEWESIYTGSDLNFSDTAGTWNTVQYRIKASVDGLFGGDKLSAVVPVVSLSALELSGTDGDLGELTNDVRYTISSDTGNKISVERRVNGLLVATVEVDSGFAYAIPVVDLPSGFGTIQLSASVMTASGSPVTKSRSWTYTKPVVTIPENGAVALLSQDNIPIYPPTLAECVRVPNVFGGDLGKALELLLPLLNTAVMAVGSYEGTGTFGQDSPNSLTFDFSPQMVILSGGGQSLTISGEIKTESGTVGYIEGNTATWYSVDAERQLNQSGQTYSYVAIGKVEN